jgi:uncharacterized protein with FMN-binding domain
VRARPWRGTLMFVAATVAVATATVARHVGAGDPPESVAAELRTQGEGAASRGRAGTVTAAATPTTKTTSSRTIVGDVEQIKYGAIQVAVTFTGATITHVSTLRAPDAHQRSREINAHATPLLAAWTVAAGSAQIDTVTGATYTSEGYRRSLQSVLDRAG